MDRITQGLTIAWLMSLLGSSACLAEVSPLGASTTTELPAGVRPTHYDFAIEPDAQALTFRAKVTIAIDVEQPTDSITLHAADLSFTSARLSAAAGNHTFAAPHIQLDDLGQTATFKFGERIATGAYRLQLEYSGKINTSPAGLFAIDYDSSSGRKRALYTQFETADARRVIPSWDEPQFKATFALEATVPATQMTVSNTPIAHRSALSNDRAVVRFERSPKMSTYLLFFATGEFERINDRVGDTDLGIVTRTGAGDQGKFALESSMNLLREYNDYFGVPYPLRKLDNVAVPASAQGWAAMENWGAILTFEHALLLDPTITTQADKQKIFSIAAHEIAHQWFGNLVTMRWWDDLWLNEGFASWLESRTTERLHPEWNTALAAVDARESAMERDALIATHPIVLPSRTVEEANQRFDAISYSKGEAVLRMLEGYVGENAWRDGVRRYIQAHAYDNTVSDDLWREMEAASREPVTAIAHDFTLQPGVPLIRVEEARCDQGRTTLRLTQTEFSKDQPDKKPLSWRVPVIAKSLDGGNAVRKLVAGGTATLDVAGCAPIIVNAGQSGYYRTLYSPQQFAAIAARFGSIAPIDQLGIIADSWSLGSTGQQPTTDFFALAKATPPDADPQVWGRIANVLGTVDDYYRGEASRRARFRTFAIERLAPVLARVGWNARANEPDPVAILRVNLIDTLSALGDASVIAEARRRYAARTSDPSSIPAALRKSILGVVARHADAKTWNELHTAARAEKTPVIKDQLYYLLGGAEDEALARRALELALTAEPGPSNSPAILSSVARLHPDLTLDFALAHLPKVHALLDPFARSSFIPSLARTSGNPASIQKVKRYATEHMRPEARKSAEAVVASIDDRIRLRRDRLPAIDAWLSTAVTNPSNGRASDL
jgi:aminopeptidase N